jgi:transcription antitermination factor NusG
MTRQDSSETRGAGTNSAWWRLYLWMLRSEPADVTQAAEAYRPLLTVPAQDVCRWFALRVRSQCDFRVQELLDARGIETFVPTWSETVQWSDRVKTTVRPLFSGYVFARFAAHDDETFNASDAIRIAGVVQILPTSLNPISIPDAEIENLRLVLASRLPVTACPYVAGEQVTIESGALAGVSGVVIRTKGAARLVVRVTLLNAAVNVEIEADTVKRCT